MSDAEDKEHPEPDDPFEGVFTQREPSLWDRVRPELEKVLKPITDRAQAGIFVTDAEREPGDVENGILRATIRFTPKMLAGRTAGQLRDMGMDIDPKVPDFAELKADGAFEWVELNFTYKVKME